MSKRIRTLVLGLLAALGACGEERPDIPTAKLWQPCQTVQDCEAGQECLRYFHFECPEPDHYCYACLIPCEADDDCPPGYECYVPPIPPDSVAYICDVER